MMEQFQAQRENNNAEIHWVVRYSQPQGRSKLTARKNLYSGSYEIWALCAAKLI